MTENRSKEQLSGAKNSILTSIYEEEKLETSEDEDIDKGEWIKSKQRKKDKKSPESLSNNESDSDNPSRIRLFKRSIEHLFKPTISEKSTTQKIKTKVGQILLPDKLIPSTTNHQMNNDIYMKPKQETYSYHPFIIQFESKSRLTQLEVIQNIIHEWEKINNSLLKIKITGRQGHDGFLIFAMDQQSFNNLMIGQWPKTIDKILINVKQPRILPYEHSLVIYRVFKDWDIVEINSKLKENYLNFRKATRIIAKDSNPTQMVRADFDTSDSVQQILQEGHVSIGESIHQVRSYFAPVRVPICYKCHHYDHNTSQCTNLRTCFRCNTVHDYATACTRPIQCANCKQAHYSGHASCPQVQQIRQKLKEQQNLNRNKILIQTAFEKKSENFPLLPSPKTSMINSTSIINNDKTQLRAQRTDQNVKQTTALSKNEISQSIEQILLAHTQQIENVLDKKFNQMIKQITKIDKNLKQSDDNNRKSIHVIKNKIIPVIVTLTSILAANISDLTMKNILSSILQSFSDECDDILNQDIFNSVMNPSITSKACN